MNNGLEGLFSSPVYFAILTDEQQESIRKEMDSAVQSIEWVTPDRWHTHKLSTKTFDENDIDKYNMTNFDSIMKKHLEIYCNTIGFVMRPFTVKSWFSRFDKGEFGHTHTHNSTDISGVYYHDTNGQDGDLFFEPHAAIKSSLCYNSNRWYHKPQRGKILLFPGWLEHGIEMNRTDNTRISFAFNISFERT